MNNERAPEIIPLKDEKGWIIGQVHGGGNSLWSKYYVFCKDCMYAQHERTAIRGDHETGCKVTNKVPPENLLQIAKLLRGKK
jgi:hypothetical protein